MTLFSRRPVRLSAALLLAAASTFAQQATLSRTYLVVTDRTSNNILRYETNASFKDAFVQSPIYLPESVVFGPDQNLYISSYSTGSIERYNGATGNYVGRFVGGAGSNLRNPEGITFGPDGNLYVVDRTQSAVLRYDGGTGAFIDQFVRPGSGGYNNAGGITFGPDGNLYVTSGTISQSGGGTLNPQVLRFDGSSGAFKDIFVSTRSGGLDTPFSLLFGPDGNLYVSNVTGNNILRYDGRTGAFLNQFVPSGSGGLSRPTGMAFGPDGNFYVASSYLPTVGILRYNATSGAFLDTFIPAGEGGLAGPTDILFYTFESQIAPRGQDPALATDPSGNRVIVWTDDNLVKLQPFDPNGASTSPSKAVSSSSEVASKPKIAALGNTGYLLAWQAKPPASAPRIAILPLPPGASPPNPPPPISNPPPSDSDTTPSISGLSNGRGGVVWSRTDSTGRGIGIFGRVVDANGTPVGSEITLSSTTTSSDESPSIASDGNGHAIVSWIRRKSDGTAYVVAGATDANLQPAANAFIVDDGSSGSVGIPSASANSSGKAALAWPRTSGSNSRILLLPVGMDISPAGGITTVNGDLSRGATLPQVSISSGGASGVIWQYNGLLGGTGVYGRAVDQNGTIEKADFVVSDAANNTEAFRAPAIAVLPSGHLTVTSAKTSGPNSGIYTRDQPPPPRPSQSASCTQNSTTLCLSGDRFAVSATWRTVDGNFGSGQAVRLTADTGYFTFFDAANVEVVVKVLGACGVNSRFWVFAGGLTNVNVVLTVRDTQTNAVKTYTNPLNAAFQPIQDTDAFATCSASTPIAPQSVEPVRLQPISWNESDVASMKHPIPPAATCTQNATTLCLNADRFAVSATWRTSDGASGQAQAVRLTADTGYFTFFNASNVEAVIKVLNGCGLNARYWVFAGGLTNVNVVVTVRDTLNGTVKTFTNPLNTAFQPVQETGAFATCP